MSLSLRTLGLCGLVLLEAVSVRAQPPRPTPSRAGYTQIGQRIVRLLGGCGLGATRIQIRYDTEGEPNDVRTDPRSTRCLHRGRRRLRMQPTEHPHIANFTVRADDRGRLVFTATAGSVGGDGSPPPRALVNPWGPSTQTSESASSRPPQRTPASSSASEPPSAELERAFAQIEPVLRGCGPRRWVRLRFRLSGRSGRPEHVEVLGPQTETVTRCLIERAGRLRVRPFAAARFVTTMGLTIGPPALVPTLPNVTGTRPSRRERSRRAVQAALASLDQRLGRCGEGKIDADITISPPGRVQSASLRPTEPKVDRACIERVLSDLRIVGVVTQVELQHTFDLNP